MARYKLLIEYDGSRYHGWQQNAGVKTIQGEIIKACEQIFNTRKIELYGSGRTDAGVHALGQVAHLDVPTQMHAEDIGLRLNGILPYDIHILNSESCDEKFHARHSAIARSYVYIISQRRSAFGKRYTWWVKEDLSVDKMYKASEAFRGFHDFSSFGAASADDISTLAEIKHIEIRNEGKLIIIHILGTHFLWMMVRRITGVLVYAGKGKLTVKEIKGFLHKHSERPSQLAAPSAGLFLQRIYYPGESFDYHAEIPLIIR
ncbi:MAG TPA: tRNA pseudouridine(38-40) synthase TruA [Bacteroidales bacterium]|jgi:tRNA pseudouridine38-40 synthase|nr:tRNA pseudouridine(38-40) synthase TruA [Bacteroidales bacterium]